MDRSRQRRYAAILLFAALAGLAASELLVRSIASNPGSLTLSQKLVVKALTNRNGNVVLGDSHVGIQDWHAPYAFLGRGGLTPRELERLAIAYFRNKPGGRVMIEVGPQMVAENRQDEWRSLARHSFVRQLLPFSIFVLEPELIAAVEQRVMEIAEPVKRSSAAPEASMKGKRGKRAVKGSRTGRTAGIAKKYMDFSKVPPGIREMRTRHRVREQRPAEKFESGVAWQAQERLVRRLVSRDATVCLIRVPVSPGFEAKIREHFDEWGFRRHREAVVALARALGVRYIDYVDLGLDNLPLGYFANQDHLNPLGHAIYWPAAEDACFAESRKSPMLGRNGPLLFKRNLVNPGFEAESPADKAPAGWTLGANRALQLLGASSLNFPGRISKSRQSFGAEVVPGAAPVPPWSLSKRFRLGDASRILARVRILPGDARLPDSPPELARGHDYFARNDAFMRIRFRNARGEPIRLDEHAEFSRTASAQRLLAGPEARAASDWWELSHAVDVPPGARAFEIQIVATGGRNGPAPVGKRRKGAAILVDEFELLADGRLDEIGEKPARKPRAAGSPASGDQTPRDSGR